MTDQGDEVERRRGLESGKPPKLDPALLEQISRWTAGSHLAALFLATNGQLVFSDDHGSSFLHTGHVLRLVRGQLCCAEARLQARLDAALGETLGNGRTTSILLHALEQPDKRFCLTFAQIQQRPLVAIGGHPTTMANVLCLIARLDGQRIATARQLMDLFGLSKAEARLARALCHGDSVEDYARNQGLRLPTIRTQLSSVFSKTGTRRQTDMVRLVARIPVMRDPL